MVLNLGEPRGGDKAEDRRLDVPDRDKIEEAEDVALDRDRDRDPLVSPRRFVEDCEWGIWPWPCPRPPKD